MLKIVRIHQFIQNVTKILEIIPDVHIFVQSHIRSSEVGKAYKLGLLTKFIGEPSEMEQVEIT